MKCENNQKTTVTYRGWGLGEKLLSNAIAWMDEMGAHTKTVSVAVGNETAFRFYERFGFYPRKTVMEQIKKEEQYG